VGTALTGAAKFDSFVNQTAHHFYNDCARRCGCLTLDTKSRWWALTGYLVGAIAAHPFWEIRA